MTQIIAMRTYLAKRTAEGMQGSFNHATLLYTAYEYIVQCYVTSEIESFIT
jgi:hypothetical protein